MDRSGAPVRSPVASVALELTASCNQHCDYCYNEWREDGGKATGKSSSADWLRRVERLLEAFELDHVTLTGGEPLSHPAFFPVARRFRDAGVRVQVISNGTLITRQLAHELRSVGLSFIQVTLNGPDAALHDAHVGRGFFERTLRGVRHLTDEGVPVAGCIVITKKNAAVVDRILELWQSFGVRQVALSRFSPAGYAARHVAQLLPSAVELERAFELAQPFGKSMRLQCTMPVPPCVLETERFPEIQFGVCPIGTSSQEFAVGPDGRLRHCTLHGGAIGAVDDIRDPTVDLRELVRAPEVIHYRKTAPEFCAGCVHEETCAGGCGAASAWVFASRRHVDPLVQQHVDPEFSERLAFARQNGRTHLELVR